MSESFFTTTDGEWFQPTPHTRGPWDVNACHAGPPTGLLARASEQRIPNQRLIRIAVDLVRPIPFDGFHVSAVVEREGRTVSTSVITLTDKDGKERAIARALHMKAQPPTDLPTYVKHYGSVDDSSPGAFPIQRTLHGEPGFNGSGVQVRYPAGQNCDPGPTIVWLRTVPLLPNEVPSPFQKICPLADCGNAFSRNAEPWDVNFLNTDLTIVLHRDPAGDWLGSDSVGFWEPNGLGTADAQLFDEQGCVGRAIQSLLLRPAR